MAEEKSFSAIGVYLGEINNTLDLVGTDHDFVRLFGKNLSTEYFKQILRALAEIEDQHKEIQSVLEEIGGRNFGFVRSINVDHLILNIKFYVMSWSTLTDMVASIISKTFNLGIAENDIQFGVIMRNEHVLKSSLPEIIKKHSKCIDIHNFNKHRNEIVHRGRMLDPDVLAVKSERNSILSSRYSLLGNNPISEEEFNARSSALNKKVAALASQKQTYYSEHYQCTLVLVSEVLVELARRTIELYKRGLITPA